MAYIKSENIQISTSLNGPASVHDYNRKLRSMKSSYEIFAERLKNCSDIGVPVSALMTTTRKSLDKFPQIVDEYISKGFDGIFFRPLNPYGFAHKKIEEIGYSLNEFIQSYRQGLDYIIEQNKAGRYFVEYYAQLLLTRMLTSYPTGFVDLQSPAGAGISGVIYDYNGDVKSSDEGRKLSRWEIATLN
jgi:sulfatase maturation enzyme AslB (radical SAM superfamily)